MATGKAFEGNPDAGNPYVRIEGKKVASAAMPRRGSLLYKEKAKQGKPHAGSRTVSRRAFIALGAVATAGVAAAQTKVVKGRMKKNDPDPAHDVAAVTDEEFDGAIRQLEATGMYDDAKRLPGRTDARTLARNKEYVVTWTTAPGSDVKFALDAQSAQGGMRLRRDAGGLRLAFGGMLIIVK